MDEFDFEKYEEKCKLIKQENESLLESKYSITRTL